MTIKDTFLLSILTVFLLITGCQNQSEKAKPDKTESTQAPSASAKNATDGQQQKSKPDSIPLLKTISHGEKIDIQSHLPSGKYTLLMFTADW